jgi:hypothetical protein
MWYKLACLGDQNPNSLKCNQAMECERQKRTIKRLTKKKLIWCNIDLSKIKNQAMNDICPLLFYSFDRLVKGEINRIWSISPGEEYKTSTSRFLGL